ncbi:MAG: putative Na+/H+ antiporter [Bdellovibrionales bacterium]|nr:putative Na+/H+ antiporter [Bdellovibrionales bacterium]
MFQSLRTTDAVASICFLTAIIHTFSVSYFQSVARRYRSGSVAENLFHLLGEVEVVFGLWAFVFVGFLMFSGGTGYAIQYLETRNFTEPAFVFVILVMCATRPVLEVAQQVIESVAAMIPSKILGRSSAFYFTALSVGPILGSFITEPAAMAVTALILRDRIYSQSISDRLKYVTLALLFVNVSIGGTLMPFAAPPVLMVAQKWGWDIPFMLTHFGWKAACAILIQTGIATYWMRNELSGLSIRNADSKKGTCPVWVKLSYLAFLAATVAFSHHMVVFIAVFLFFLGLVSVTQEYQAKGQDGQLKLREGLLVSFFLGGLVVLGGPQRWWLEPLLTRLDSLALFLGATGLTGVTDNAALTYLGAQVPGLSDASKYALVAGAVTGGGLTVIANAPNPAGFGILNASFGKDGINPAKLFAYALPPTLIAAASFWFL